MGHRSVIGWALTVAPELHDAAALDLGGLNEVHVVYLRNTGDAFGVSELP